MKFFTLIVLAWACKAALTMANDVEDSRKESPADRRRPFHFSRKHADHKIHLRGVHNEDETSMSYGEPPTIAPPASEPTTSDPPTSYAPTSYPPTSELELDGPCSGRGTLDPSGRQCTCQEGYFPTLTRSGPDCLKVVPVGLGCKGQRKPDCREMKFRPKPMCCPSPPRGDLLRCVPTQGRHAGQC